MKKIIYILVSSLIIIFLIGCAEQVEEESAEKSNVGESAGVVKEFTMTAKKFEFIPSTITVNKGDKVKIIITSTDVTHGFSLPDFNINEKLEPGQPVTVEFVADKVGTFTFRCSVPCGSGHSSMGGTLIVK